MGVRLSQYRLATNADFRGVVEAAVMHAAGQILQEDEATHGHAERAALARTFMAPAAGRDEYLTQFLWMAAMNPTIQTDAIDGDGVDASMVDDVDVDYVVASAWDMIAGVVPQGE